MGSSVLKTTRWPVTIFCSVRLFHSLMQHPGESLAVAKVSMSERDAFLARSLL